MPAVTTTAFATLYPDVDPTKGLPLSASERLSLTVAFAILAFGAVRADVVIAGVGLGLVVLAAFLQSNQTRRRVRAEARSRFPDQDWAEYRAASRLKLNWALPIFLLAAIAACATGFWFLPESLALPGALGIASFVGLLVWFLPGLNPIWNK